MQLVVDWDGTVTESDTLHAAIERFGDVGDEYYRIVQGEVSGFDDGDSVEVWFKGGGHTSESFTFEAVTTIR